MYEKGPVLESQSNHRVEFRVFYQYECWVDQKKGNNAITFFTFT